MALPKPEITIPQLPSGPLEPSDVFIATTTLGASKKVAASEVFGVRRVATFAAMVALLVEGQPRQFTVLNDEVQGIQKVPYQWDGVELFVYGTLVEPQPTI